MRTLAERLAVGTVYREGDSIYFNQATEEITGYRRSEIPTIDDWFSALYGDEAPTIATDADSEAPAKDKTDKKP